MPRSPALRSRPRAVRLAWRWSLWVGITAAVLLFAVPHGVHAQSVSELLLNFSLKSIIQGLLSLGNFLIYLEGWVVTQLLAGISVLLTWQNVTSNDMVQRTWGIARDVVNMGFIIGMVLIAFATIFRPFNFLKGFYWRDALPKLLLAAILINLSLGLSQTVLLVSNKVTTTLTNVLGDSVSNLTAVLGADVLLTAPLLVTDTSAAEQQLVNRLGLPTGTNAEVAQLNEQQRQAYDECRAETNERLLRRLARGTLNAYRWATGGEGAPTPTKTAEECLREIAAGRQVGEDRSAGGWWDTFKLVTMPGLYAAEEAVASISSMVASSANYDTSFGLALLVSLFFNFVMIGILIIALLSAIIFFMFRIVAIWFLMAFSAVAFGLMWLPGQGTLGKWWTQFWGWNVFGPLYLLVLILGMTFLQQRGNVMLSIAGDTSVEGIFLETVFFFLFTLIIFVGGLGMALRGSFAQAVRSTTIIGGAAQRFGAFGALTASQWVGQRVTGGAARVAGGVARATGAQAAYETGAASYQAAKERARQAYERRRPELLRLPSREERLATAQRRLGVYGGAQAEQQELAKRIGATQGKLKNKIATLGKDEQVPWLQGQMNARDRATRLAARQLLLERGKLTPEQIGETKGMYPKGLPQTEFDKTINKASAQDPDSIFEYRLNELEKTERFRSMTAAEQGQAREDLVVKHYSTALNNTEAFGKLSKQYFEKGTEQYARMDRAIGLRFPKDRARARASAFGRLSQSVDDASKNRALKEWFST